MKKFYKKGTVYPTPPPIPDHLSFLPAAIFTLTLALSPDDREVLAYLLTYTSNSYANIKNINNNNKNKNGGEHATSFNCSYFRCYMSFWVRWDASPNRQLIHEIIDAFEEGLTHQVKKEKGKKDRRRKGKGVVGTEELSKVKSEFSLVKDECRESDFAGSSIAGGEGRQRRSWSWRRVQLGDLLVLLEKRFGVFGISFR